MRRFCIRNNKERINRVFVFSLFCDAALRTIFVRNIARAFQERRRPFNGSEEVYVLDERCEAIFWMPKELGRHGR